MMTLTQLRLLAAQRVARGQQLTREHVRDGAGCCRRCGRPYPCDGHRLGLALVAYYQHLTSTGGGLTDPRPSTRPARSDGPSAPAQPVVPANRLYLLGVRGRRTGWLVRHAPR